MIYRECFWIHTGGKKNKSSKTKKYQNENKVKIKENWKRKRNMELILMLKKKKVSPARGECVIDSIKGNLWKNHMNY